MSHLQSANVFSHSARSLVTLILLHRFFLLIKFNCLSVIVHVLSVTREAVKCGVVGGTDWDTGHDASCTHGGGGRAQDSHDLQDEDTGFDPNLSEQKGALQKLAA